MNQTQEVVDNLKKVKVRAELSGKPDNIGDHRNLPESGTEFEFIVGLSVDGLTGFEKNLANKTVGDEISMTVSPKDFHETFGHLCHSLPFMALTGHPDSECRFSAKIISISTPENREIVKAMSEMTACGCGCGGH